jgi:two-component system NtrC family sensor kinase
VRLGLGLGLGAAAILWLADQLSLDRQRAQLEDLVGISADRVAETIHRAAHDGMLRNDVEGVRRIIENIGAQEGIDSVRIYNKEGRVRVSSRPAEEGTLVDKRSDECIACHAAEQPKSGLERRDRIRMLSRAEGRVLGIITPIYNEPKCTACHVHSASQRVLGVLDVRLSMAQADAALRASELQMQYGLFATGLAVLLLSFVMLWAFVLRPVKRLRRAMERAGGGDLAARVPVRSSDEMGELARSWNETTAELQRAREELRGWNRTLEERVEEKTRQLEETHHRMLVVEKMASLGKLAAVVAHEINNPLAGIRTYARVLRRQFAAGASAPPPPPEQAHETDRILEMVDAEAGRCGDIVRNLLAFSRDSAARFATTELGPLVERCRLLLHHQAEMLGVTLEARVAPGLPKLVCDAVQVQQMLLALAMNALEATPANGRVTIEARPDTKGVALAVEDTGSGIPREHQDRIFEPFFTTKEAGKGVGLGLAVVYGIVTRHHGEIDLASEPGQGTTFTIRLPLVQPEEAMVAQETAPAGGQP